MDEPRPENNAAPDQSALRIISSAPVTWKIKRVLWSVMQATFYRLTFQNWSAWRRFLLRLFGAKIGAHCTIRRTSRVYYPWLLEMGDLSCLGDDCVIYNLARIVIAERAIVSQEAYLCAGTHDYTKLSMPLVTIPIYIGADAWICARAFIGPGVYFGDGSIAGAGAIVMKNVPPWTIVAGNPAVPIKERKLENH